MTSNVQTTVSPPSVKQRAHAQLLRHCLALDETAPRRAPAKLRLQEALGPELAYRLVTSLTAANRR